MKKELEKLNNSCMNEKRLLEKALNDHLSNNQNTDKWNNFRK